MPTEITVTLTDEQITEIFDAEIQNMTEEDLINYSLDTIGHNPYYLLSVIYNKLATSIYKQA